MIVPGKVPGKGKRIRKDSGIGLDKRKYSSASRQKLIISLCRFWEPLKLPLERLCQRPVEVSNEVQDLLP